MGDLVHELAGLHAEFGLYDPAMFAVEKENNIIERLSEIAELDYLQQFYNDYESHYIEAFRTRSDPTPSLRLTRVSRSVDLPYIGEIANRNHRAKVMMVFEGSLSDQKRLSVTVLACLWPITPAKPIHQIFTTFWPSRYDDLVRYLCVSAQVAREVYVVDAVRIGNDKGKSDLKKNRLLLEREIELVNPELIVLVGNMSDHIAKNAQKVNRRTFVKVPYPAKWRKKEKVASDDEKYETLCKRLVEVFAS